MLTIKSRSKERRESCKRKEKEGWLNTEARASRAFHLSAQVILESRTREKKRLSFPLSFRAKSEEKRGCIVPYWLRRRSSSGPVLARWATWEILSVAGWIRKMGDRCGGSFSCVGGKNTTLSGWIYRDSSLVIIENDNYNWQSRFEDQDIYIYITYDMMNTRRGFIDACGIGFFFCVRVKKQKGENWMLWNWIGWFLTLDGWLNGSLLRSYCVLIRYRSRAKLINRDVTSEISIRGHGNSCKMLELTRCGVTRANDMQSVHQDFILYILLYISFTR